MRTFKVLWFTAKCIMFLLLFAILLCLTTPILPLLSIRYEDILVKWDVDNPYVDSNFRKWEKTEVGELGTLRIPSNWSICKINDHYYIVDGNGKTWAVGAIFSSENATKEEYLRFISLIEGKNAVSFYSLYDQENMWMKDSHISKDVVEFVDNAEKTFLTLNLRNDDNMLATFVLMDKTKSEPDNYEIMEAILFAYAYSDS